MNIKVTFKILGALLLFLSCAIVLPVPLGVVDGDGTHWALALSAIVGALLGCTLIWICRSAHRGLGHREGFAS